MDLYAEDEFSDFSERKSEVRSPKTEKGLTSCIVHYEKTPHLGGWGVEKRRIISYFNCTAFYFPELTYDDT